MMMMMMMMMEQRAFVPARGCFVSDAAAGQELVRSPTARTRRHRTSQLSAGQLIARDTESSHDSG